MESSEIDPVLTTHRAPNQQETLEVKTNHVDNRAITQWHFIVRSRKSIPLQKRRRNVETKDTESLFGSQSTLGKYSIWRQLPRLRQASPINGKQRE